MSGGKDMEVGDFPYIFPRQRNLDHFANAEEVFVHVGACFFRRARIVSTKGDFVSAKLDFSGNEVMFHLKSPDVMRLEENEWFRVNHLPLPETWWEPQEPPRFELEESFASMAIA